MADNINVTPGAGATVATDDDGGVQHQWVKIKFGGDGSFTAVSTTSGFPVQILSLPDLGFNSSVKITSLPDLGLNSSVKITSLPDLGLNSAVKITSLPNFAVGQVVSISGLTSASVSISNLTTTLQLFSGTTIAITSLPPLGSGTVSINNFTFVLSVTNAGVFPISSLPSLAFGQSVTVTPFTFYPTVTNLSLSTSIGNFPVQIIPARTNWRFTATGTVGTTFAVSPITSSQTAIYITNMTLSNENTAGNILVVESSNSIAIRPVIERVYLDAKGGITCQFTNPIELDTNTALYAISNTVANHSVFFSGFTALKATSL